MTIFDLLILLSLTVKDSVPGGFLRQRETRESDKPLTMNVAFPYHGPPESWCINPFSPVGSVTLVVEDI